MTARPRISMPGDGNQVNVLYRTLLKMWVLPPVVNIVLIILGLVLLRRYARLGKMLILLGVLSLYVFATPWFANLLHHDLDRFDPISASSVVNLADQVNPERAAIVVLGAGFRPWSAQYGGEGLDESAVTRLTYGVWLSRQTGIPLMVTGGMTGWMTQPHGDTMAAYMQQHFERQPEWVESQSRTTAENAIYAQQLLQRDGKDTVVLVTHAYHMQRAVRLFENQGLIVLPAPAESAYRDEAPLIVRLIPTTKALDRTRAALHEYLGLLWYRLKGVS